MDIGSKLQAFYNFKEDYYDKFNSYHLTNSGTSLNNSRAIFGIVDEIDLPEYGVFAGDVPFALEVKIEDTHDSIVSAYLTLKAERNIMFFRQYGEVHFALKSAGNWEFFKTTINQQNVNHFFINFIPNEKIEIWIGENLVDTFTINFNTIDSISGTSALGYSEFEGGIHHFAIYHDILTSEDIAYLYNSGNGRDIVDDLIGNTLEYSPEVIINDISTNSVEIKLTAKTDKNGLQGEGINLASFHVYGSGGILIASDPDIVIENNLDENGYPYTVLFISQLNEGQEYQIYGQIEYPELAITTANSPLKSFTTLLGNQPPEKPLCETSNITGASATLSALVTDPDSDVMYVQFIDAINGDLIGVVTDVSNGGTATLDWTGLQAGYTYQWYAIANDGEVWGEQSDTQSFITPVINRKPNTPQIYEIVPTIANATIKANIIDPDGNGLSAKFWGKECADVGSATVIGEKTGLTDLATLTWSGLLPNTEYQVYVVTNDGTLDSDPSATMTFKTQQAIAPEITLAETRNIKLNEATLHLQFKKYNSLPLTVEFLQGITSSLEGSAIHIWQLENTDNAINSNFPAAITGAPELVDGINGKCYRFRGVSYTDGITLLPHANCPTENDDTTISLWFTSECTSGGDTVARVMSRDASDYYGFCIDQSTDYPQDITVYWDQDSNATIVDKIAGNGFQHLIMKWDTVNNRFYCKLNGVLIVDQAFSGFTSAVRDLVIGCNSESGINASSNQLEGKVDEVYIFDRLTTDLEDDDLYSEGVGNFFNGVFLSWSVLYSISNITTLSFSWIWSGLIKNTSYGWAARISDAYATSEITQNQIFTTISDNYPPNKPIIHSVSNITGNSAELDIEATDPDGNRLAVSLHNQIYIEDLKHFIAKDTDLVTAQQLDEGLIDQFALDAEDRPVYNNPSDYVLRKTNFLDGTKLNTDFTIFFFVICDFAYPYNNYAVPLRILADNNNRFYLYWASSNRWRLYDQYNGSAQYDQYFYESDMQGKTYFVEVKFSNGRIEAWFNNSMELYLNYNRVIPNYDNLTIEMAGSNFKGHMWNLGIKNGHLTSEERSAILANQDVYKPISAFETINPEPFFTFDRDITSGRHIHLLSGLVGEKTYNVSARSNDGNLDSEYSGLVEFMTASTANKPIEGITKHITPTSVVLRIRTDFKNPSDRGEVHFFNAENDQLIGIATNCIHGVFVETQWTALIPEQEYSWYAVTKMPTGDSPPSDVHSFETLFSNYENLDNLPFIFSNSGWKNITGFEFFEDSWQLPESVEVYSGGEWHKLNYAQFEMQKCPIYRRNMKDGYMFEMGVVLNNVPSDMEVDEVGILVKYSPSDTLEYNDHAYKQNLFGTMRDGYYGCFSIPNLTELQIIAYRIYARVGTTIFYAPEDFDSNVTITYLPASFVEERASVKCSIVELNSKLTKKLTGCISGIDQVTIYDNSMLGLSGIFGNAFLDNDKVSLVSNSMNNCFTKHNDHKINIKPEYGVQ